MSNNPSGTSKARINALVEKLRSKMKNFTVMDRQGELMGEVKDLMLDVNSQLNLVVSRLASEQNSPLLLLVSKLIQKIDPQNKLLFVDINKAEMNDLPEYGITESGIEPESPTNPINSNFDAVHEGTTKNIAPESVMQTPFSEPQNTQDQMDDNSVIEPFDTPEVLEEELIRLLEERLLVDSSKRKIGEVIVRKEIETRMVQVPVRREKLIIEQVSPERKQLAEIDLGQGEILGIDLTEGGISGIDLPELTSLDGELTVRGEFKSPKIASLLLNAIALERRQGCKNVRVQIVVEDAERQKTYQEWFDRCSGSQASQSENISK